MNTQNNVCRREETRLKLQVCAVCQTFPCRCRTLTKQKTNETKQNRIVQMNPKHNRRAPKKTKCDKEKAKLNKGKSQIKCKTIRGTCDCVVTAPCSRPRSTMRHNTPVRTEIDHPKLSFQDIIWIILTPQTINCLNQLLQDQYGLTEDEANKYIDERQIYVLENLRKLTWCSTIQSSQFNYLIKSKYRNPQRIQTSIINILNKQIGSQLKAKDVNGEVLNDDRTSETSDNKNQEYYEMVQTVSGINLLEKFVGDIQHESKRMKLCSEYCEKMRSCKALNDKYVPWKFSTNRTLNMANKNSEDIDLCCKHILSSTCRPICCETLYIPRLTNCVPMLWRSKTLSCRQTCQSNFSKLNTYTKYIEVLKRIIENQSIQKNSTESPASFQIALNMYKLMSKILERTLNTMAQNGCTQECVETANILQQNKDENRKINYCYKTFVRSSHKPETSIVTSGCEPQLKVVKDKTTEISASAFEVREIQTLSKQIRNITAQTELDKRNTFVQTEADHSYYIQTISEPPGNKNEKDEINSKTNKLDTTHSNDSQLSEVDITEVILYEMDQNSKIYLSRTNDSIHKYFQFTLSSSLFNLDFDKIFQKQIFPNKELNKSNLSMNNANDNLQEVCQKIVSNEFFDANCIDLKIKVHDSMEETRTSMYIYNKKSIRREDDRGSDEPIIINLDYNKDIIAKRILDPDVSDDTDTFSDASCNTFTDSVYIDANQFQDINANDILHYKNDDNNILHFINHGQRRSDSTDTFQSAGPWDCNIPSNNRNQLSNLDLDLSEIT